jgi:hypothetical protein
MLVLIIYLLNVKFEFRMRAFATAYSVKADGNFVSASLRSLKMIFSHDY